ncbi:ATP-binding protein [Nonomuraea sp. NPDC050022]|uniref:ATP-binding protein n=1 Tax=unclassified Nonomuraea TaxID=2593643 RepID=UPI00340C9F5A
MHGQGTRVRTHGLGLGLTIVRAITLAHQGRIAVTARSGGGLDITIDLPRDPTATADRPARWRDAVLRVSARPWPRVSRRLVG